MGFFSRFWSSLFGSFKNVFAFLLPVLKSDYGKLINSALPIAEEIVTRLATGNYSGDAKREFAVTQLAEALVSAGLAAVGLPIPASILNLIIEMAVARLKAS